MFNDNYGRGADAKRQGQQGHAERVGQAAAREHAGARWSSYMGGMEALGGQ